jgi:hypothetical protein
MALRPDRTAVLKAFEIVLKGRGVQPRLVQQNEWRLYSLLKTLGLALLYRSCHSDAERGGGICDTEELCVTTCLDNRRSCERTRLPAVRRRNDKTVGLRVYRLQRWGCGSTPSAAMG